MRDDAALPAVVDCPYIGLSPFDPEHEPYFFGRDDDAQLIASHVVSGGITVLQGASGVGKTSVLGAALPKALESLAPGTLIILFRRWDAGFYDCMRREAATRVNERLPISDPGLAEVASVTGPGGLEDLETLARRWSRVPEPAPLVFVFDQFEQYFTGQDYGTVSDDKSFEADLARIVRRRGLGAHVLISIRADALYELNRLRACVPDIFTRSVVLEFLDPEAARDAITKPLGVWRREGREGPVEAEPDLVETLLAQVQRPGTQQIQTPYLQLALTRLWREERRANSLVLHRETLHRLGGPTGIAEAHFNKVMDGLSEDERRLSARIFGRLVTPSGMKIALAPEDLAGMLEEDAGKVEAVLERLDRGQSWIIHRVQPPQGAPARFEIFHDVLARPILKWTATEKERAKHERELASAAAELERERRRKRRYMTVAILACLALVVVLANTVYAVAKHQEARAQRGRMLATQAERRLEAGDRRTALLLVLEALPPRSRGWFDPAWNWLNWPDEAYALGVLDRALGTPIPREIRSGSERLTFAGFDPRGGLVTGTDKGAVDLWPADSVERLAAWADPGAEAHTRLEPVAAADGSDAGRAITSVAFDRDGSHMVTADQNGLVAFWKVGESKPAAAWSVGGQTRAFAAISPDATRVATVAIGDRKPRLWTIAQATDGGVTAVEESVTWTSSHRNGLSSVGFDPDGRRLVTTSFGGAAAVWDIASGRLLQSVRQEGGVFMARFSPDGRRLVTGGWDGKARIWNLFSRTANPDCLSPCNVEDGKPTEPSLTLDHGRSPVLSASFDASGREVVTTAQDGVVRIWNAQTGGLLRRIEGPPPQPGGRWIAASLSGDGRRLVASSGGERLLLWQLYGTAEPPRVRRIPEGVVAIAASADGGRVAIASQTGLEIVGSGCESPRQVDLDLPPLGVAMTPDGGRVALAVGDRVRLLSCDGRKRDDELPARGSLVLSLAYDPAGKRLATATQDGSVRLWTAAGEFEGEILSTPGDPITALTFGHDGRLLYAGSTQGRIHVVDPTSRRTVPTPELSQPGRAVLALGFAPGGRYLVASTVGQNDGFPSTPVILDAAPPGGAAVVAGNLNRYLEALQAANVLAVVPPAADGGGAGGGPATDGDAGQGRVVVLPVERMFRPGPVLPPPEDVYGRISFATERLMPLPAQDRVLSAAERCEHGLQLKGCAPSRETPAARPAPGSVQQPTTASRPASMTTSAGGG